MSHLSPPADVVSTSYRQIVTLAWPIVLANAAVPLLGVTDTAVIGNTGSVADLGGIGLGALVFSFVYWTFGFLRMGTTGFVAQAAGRGDSAEVRATAARGLLLALALGTILLVLQRPIQWSALQLLSGPPDVEQLTARYVAIRIWSAPASLSLFVVMGTLIGLGRTRQVLVVQLVLNGVNIVLDVWFAGVLHRGVAGIALGTVIAEWIALLVALMVLVRVLKAQRSDDEPWWPAARIADRARMRATLSANTDIMVRTLFLLLGFGWFTNRGAAFGAVILAANHVLLQLLALSAYLLDGYAHATEILVGRAVGQGGAGPFDAAVRRSTELAGVSALALAALGWLLGPWTIDHITNLAEVQQASRKFLPYALVYITLSFAAFQLDGVFIGATGTRAMRNASVLSCLGFVGLSMLLVPMAGNVGLWLSFIAFVVLRAIALGIRLPSIRPGPARRPTAADTRRPASDTAAPSVPAADPRRSSS